MADRRPLVFCATCGVKLISRSSATKSRVSKPFVAAERNRLRPLGVLLYQVPRRQPFGVAGDAGGHSADDQPVPVFHGRMAHEGQLRLLAPALAVRPGVRTGGGGMGVVAALLTMEVLLTVAAAIGRRAGAILWSEALGAGQASSSVLSTEKCWLNSSARNLGCARTAARNRPPRPQPAGGRGSW